MENAKKALELALKSLPENCLFNIYSFGSRYTNFFQNSKPYNPNNSASAIEHVRAMRADYGGTEIMEPLRDILESPDSFEGQHRLKEIFLLTDGSVGNVDQIVSMVQG